MAEAQEDGVGNVMTIDDTKREVEAAVFGQRVYEYRDDQGVVYYSLTRAPNILSPPKRLKMQGRLGIHLARFLVSLRRLGDSFEDPEDGDAGNDGDAG